MILINWICHTKSESNLFFFTRNLWNAQNYLLNCVLVLWIHKGYCVVKKLMWNVRIKAFWHTNIIITLKPYNSRIFFSMRGVHCSKSIPRAEGEINLFFPLKPHNNPFLNIGSTALLLSSTCCVILPHAVKSR